MSLTLLETIPLNSGSGTQMNFTLSNAVQIGDWLVWSNGSYPGVQAIAGLTMTGMTSVAANRVEDNGVNRMAEIWDAVCTTAGATSGSIDMTANVSSAPPRMNLRHLRASAGTVGRDGGGGTNGSSTAPTSGSATPTAGANVILFATEFSLDASASAGPTGSFTAETEAAVGGYAAAYRAVSSASGSYSTGWTLPFSDSWAGVIAAYKEVPANLFRPYLF